MNKEKEKVTYKRIESAASKFVTEEDAAFREEVVKAIKSRSRRYMQNYNLTGGEFYKKKAERLAKQSFRYQYCGYTYIVLPMRLS